MNKVEAYWKSRNITSIPHYHIWQDCVFYYSWQINNRKEELCRFQFSPLDGNKAFQRLNFKAEKTPCYPLYRPERLYTYRDQVVYLTEGLPDTFTIYNQDAHVIGCRDAMSLKRGLDELQYIIDTVHPKAFIVCPHSDCFQRWIDILYELEHINISIVMLNEILLSATIQYPDVNDCWRWHRYLDVNFSFFDILNDHTNPLEWFPQSEKPKLQYSKSKHHEQDEQDDKLLQCKIDAAISTLLNYGDHLVDTREEWIPFLFLCKGLDLGWAFFDAVCQQSDNYKPAENFQKWEQEKKRNASPGALINLARQQNLSYYLEEVKRLKQERGLWRERPPHPADK